MSVRYDRALAYLAAGQKSKARADFEKILGSKTRVCQDVLDRLAQTT